MKMDAQINFRTSSEIKEQVEEMAKSRGLKPSQLINEIVADFLNRQESQKSETINLQTLHEIVTSHEKQLEMYGKQIEILTKK
jgi:antitoxin component of RelBE/YafQ-DinJ toxin-antitoxin module